MPELMILQSTDADAPPLYESLISLPLLPLLTRFDLHVIASTLTLSAIESTRTGQSTAARLGLSESQIASLFHDLIPDARHLFDQFFPPHPSDLSRIISDDQAALQQLLTRYSSDRSNFQSLLAAIIARRAQEPNHLWQDLGLRSREELSILMKRHFAPLAAKNSSDMKWKKFLYRLICRDADYRFCTAPTCAECPDFSNCFGDESGESLLARTKNGRSF